MLSCHLGSVYITVEVSGPRPPPAILEVPDDIYHLAAFFCQSCVKVLGKGGFVTHGFLTAVEWAQDESPPFVWRAFPSLEATFLTITISGPTNRQYCPGSTDPIIPLALGSALVSKSKPNDPQDQAKNKRKEVYWVERSKVMRRGSSATWWSLGPPGIQDEMVYQCDAALGTPSANDCNAVNWQQLAAQSNTLRIGPETIFFHVNTCYLAISAAVAIALNWNQIQTAVSALIDICVQHPFQAAQGGRAYYAPSTDQVSRRQNKRQSTGLTGWNALPPHVNITIFEQTEPWTNAVEEQKTCTWQAASNGRPVASCTPT